MKKKPAFKSAFFNPRVLISFAACVIGLLLALLAFGLYPGGKADARLSQSTAQEQSTTLQDQSTTQDQSSAPDAPQDYAPTFRTFSNDPATLQPINAVPDQATCALTALVQDNSTSANARAPSTRFASSRAVYLILASELAANGVLSGNAPTSVGWNYQVHPGPSGTAPLKIYLQNTADTTYLKGLSFAAAIAGMTTVHNAATLLPGVAGPFDVTLSGGSPFTYTGGGLYVAYDWGAYGGTLAGATISIWCNSTGLVGGLAGANNGGDALGTSSFRPETRLSSSTQNDASVNELYSYGQVPFGLVPAQAIKAVVANNGALAQTSLPVTLNVTGVQTFTNGQTIPTLAACTGVTTVTFAGFTPFTIGTDNLQVSVPSDNINANNSMSKPMGISSLTYSYKVPGSTADGGVGLTGGSGAFVSKFTLNAANSVKDVILEFPAITATTYKVAIYGDAAGVPSTTALYVDATDRTVSAAGPVTIVLPSPQAVGTVFYVGIQQTNTTNAGLGFDNENPIRPASFWFSTALPVTAWTDESPGNNFKLNIGVNLLTPSGTPPPTPSATPTTSPTPTATATSTPTATVPPTPTVTPPPTVCNETEQFFNITTLVPAGWSIINNSAPAGTNTWFQGNPANFVAQSGAADSYVSVNFNSTTGSNTISNWLLTPPITLQNGAVLKFWTRTVDEPQFPDRLQVRMSTNGNSQNVGFGALGTGDFSTLLLDINPTYQPVPPPAGTPTPTPFPTPTPGVGYPNVWTQFTITLSGVVGTPKGRLAFRYFVENGGPTGINSDTIGIDTVQYACSGPLQTPTPQPTPTPTPSPSPSPGCGVTLYDQTTFAVGSGTSSQNFEAVNDAFDDMAADDFVVPAGPGWTIQKVKALGQYYNGTGPATTANVVFYNNAGGLPGAVVAGGTYNTAPFIDTAGTFEITISPPLLLTAGTYWVSVQANMDFAVGGQWAWTDRSATSNSPAAWQNPGGGFAAGCLTWGIRGATCGIDAANPDQAYLLIGCGPAAATPTPSPSPTPTPGSCQFTPAPVYPSTILDQAVASVGGNLYSFGGVSTTIIANAYKFDGTTWTAIAPLPVALEYAAAVSDGTNIYIVGGSDTAGNAQPTLYRYNVGANNYTTLTSSTTSTWNHAAVYLSGKIYKFAGTETVTDTSVNALEIYDISGGGWTSGANYPTALSFVAGWAEGSFIYGAGGIDGTSSLESTKTYRYDPVGNTWNDLAVADLPSPRWGSAYGFYTCCTTTGGIMAGGYSNGILVATVIRYDVGSNAWVTLNQLLSERTRFNGAAVGCNFYAIGGRSNASPAFVGTNDNQRFNCPCAPTPTPTPTVAVSGQVTYCSNPGAPAVSGVLMSLTGPTPAPASTSTDGSGNYSIGGLFATSNYTITPTKTALVPGANGINTVDVIATQKHFLLIGTPLSGCRLQAADVNGVGGVNTVDVIAIQRFFLTLATGTANVGKYAFNPPFISYTPVGGSNVTGQNYGAYVFGDVVGGFVHRPEGGGDTEMGSSEVPSTVESVALPEIGGVNAPVRTSPIDAKSNLVGFQGDFTFDERVVTFQEQPVQKAGLTAGNWNVSGNVLAGKGPIRTLRVSAFSNDFSPLSGSGTLFELKMNPVSKTQDAKLAWAPAPNQFIFIDTDLNTQTPNAR